MYEKRIEDDHHWIKLRSNEVFNEKENRRVYLAIMLRTLVERVLPRVTLFEWDKMMTDQSIIQMRISKSNRTKTSLSLVHRSFPILPVYLIHYLLTSVE